MSRLFRTSPILSRTHKTSDVTVVRVLFVVFALALFVATFAIYPYTRDAGTRTAKAATNSTLNFQARILTSGGAVVSDGSYNIRFKIYTGGTSGGPGGIGAANAGTLLWTETWQNSNSQGIVTKNGYISAALGSITAFSGINWDQELWVTMDVGGTGVGASPTYDGEMLQTGNKRMKVTGVPYALAAGTLQTTNGAGTLSSTLAINTPTVGNQTFQIPDQAAAGTYTICIQNATGCGFLKRGAQDTSTLGTLTAGQYLYGFSNTSATASGVLSLTNGATSTGNTLYVTSSGNPAAGSALIVANAATGVTGNLIDLQLNAVSKFSVNQAGNVIAAGTITSGAVNGLTLTSAADGFTIAGGTASRTLTVTGANITIGSTITPTAAGALAVSANGANNLSLDGGTTGAVNINGSSSGDVNIAGGSGTTGCTVTNSTGALTCTAGITSNNNTINSQTLSSTALTFTGANPTISPSTANTGITLQANGTGALTLGGISTASNTINVGTAAGNTFTQTVNIGTSATAGSTTNVNIGSTVAGTTTLQGLLAISGGTNNGVYYRNSSGNVVNTAAGTTGQCLQGVTGAAPSWSACLSAEADTLATVTSRGATTATATSFTGGLTVSNGAATAIAVTSNATVPTADQLSITNTGSTGVTTAGVNGLSIAYKGGAAAVEAAGARVDLTPGTTSGGTWSGVRVVPNATGAVAGVTENALKIDTLTTPGAGTENAISVGTGWDAVLSYNGTVLINGTGIVQSAAVSGSYTGITGVGTLTVGTWNGTQIGATYGGTGQTTTTAGDLLVGAAGNTWNKVAAVASGSCLISQGVGVAPIWGACGATNIVQAPTNTAQNTITPTTTGTVGLTVNSTSFATGGATALIVNQTATAATAVDGVDININNATNPVTNGLLINKTGAGTITSLLNLTQGAGTTTNGIIFNGTITNDITTAAARALTVVTGTTGALSLDTGTTGAINIGTNVNNKTIQIGAGTGTAASSTVNIANSASAAQTVTIGSTNGASALTLQGGTGNINLSTNSSSASVIIKTLTNSTTAFRILDASNNQIFNVDTTTVNGTGAFKLGNSAYVQATNSSGLVQKLYMTDGFSYISFDNQSGPGGIELGGNVGVNGVIAGTTITATGGPIAAQAGNGTNAKPVLRVFPASVNGGDTTGTTGQTAGSGSGITLQTSTGGAATGASGANFGGAGGAFSVLTANGGAATSGTGGAGGDISLTAGNGGNGSTTGGRGGNITLAAGTVGTGGTPTQGKVIVKNIANSTTAFQVQNASSTPVLAVDTTNQTVKVRSLSDAASLGANLFANSCTGANWSGANPYTHTAGSTTVLTCTVPSITAGATYEVAYTTAGTTAGEYFTPSMGGSNGPRIYGDVSGTVVISTTTTANMTIAPTSAQTGSFTITSVKLVTNASTPLTVLDSTGTTRLEVRATTYNTALGLSSLQSNTTGSRNTAVGNISLQSNTTGSDNAAFGYAALQYNTTGFNNTATGSFALYSNSTGSNNTANGQNALSNNSSGYNNAAFGSAALQTNNVGIQNTGIGMSALAANTSGSNNTAVGYASQSGGTTTSNNTSVGYNSLQNATGSYNTAVGTSTFTGTISGVNNTALGFNAGTSNGGFTQVTNVDNATAIGAYALVQASNSLVLGQIPTPTKVGIGTTIPLNTFSVSPVDYAVGTISQTASATVVGSGTTFTAAMVGDQLIYADGVTDTVTGFTDATHITVTTSRTHSSSAYRLHYIGLQVQSNGTTYAQGNSATQLQVKNGQGVAVLNVDTANGQLQLGNYNGGTNAVAGKLVLNNTTNANGLTIVAGATASNYTLTLPTSAGSSNDCLKNSGTAGILTFGACASGITLQAAYNSSAGATPSIAVNSTNKAVVVQNSVTSSIAAGNEYFGVRAAGASDVVYGNSIFTVNSGGVGINIGGTGNPVTSYDLSFGQGANRTIGVQVQGTAATAGNNLTVSAGQGNTTGAGGVLILRGGTGGATGAGGDVTITGGTGGATSGNGGNVTLVAGTMTSGTAGSVILKPGVGGDKAGAISIQNAAGSSILGVNTSTGVVSIDNGDAAISLHDAASPNTWLIDNWAGGDLSIGIGGNDDFRLDGKYAYLGSSDLGSKLMFGDKQNNAYGNVMVGEYGNTDTDIAQLFGFSGTNLSYGYGTGSISQSGTTTVTGVGTSFDLSMEGATLAYADGTLDTVVTVNSPTSLTVTTSRTKGSDSNYRIIRNALSVNQYGETTFQSNSSGKSFAVLDSASNPVLSVDTSSSATTGWSSNWVINNGVNNKQNELENPGFEAATEDGQYSGWAGSGVLQNNATNARTGNHVMELPSANMDICEAKVHPVQPGDIIYYEGYVKRSVGGGGTGGFYVKVLDKDFTNPAFSSDTWTDPGTSYTLRANSYTVPAGKYYVEMCNTTSAGTTGSWFFDDLYMTISTERSWVTYRNTSNSTTAFQIQNAAGTSVLNVDTTNGNLLINGVTPTTFTGSFATTGAHWSLSKQADYIYSVRDGTSFQIIDATNPASMTNISTTTVSGANRLQSIQIAGKYAYISDFGTTQFYVYDVTNAAAPTLVKTVTTASNLTDLYVSGKIGFAVGTNRHIYAYDLTNPLNPLLLSDTTTPFTTGSVLGIKTLGNYLYITGNVSGTGKLFIYDWSNSSSLILKNGAGASTNTTSPQGLTVVGRYAYVYNRTTAASFEIFDISNPSTTSAHVGTLNLTAGGATSASSPQMVVVQGSTAYITNNSASKLEIVDVTTPSAPSLLGSVTTDTNPVSIAVDGRYAYVESYGSSTIKSYNIGGAYIQAIDAGNTAVTDLQVYNNATIAGNLTVYTGLNVGQSLNVNEDLGVAGDVKFQNSSNSSTAFAVQSASGYNQILVNNSDTNNNQVANPSAEQNTTGWNPRTGTTLTRDTTDEYAGVASFKLANTATANAGMNLPIVLTANTYYTMSFMVKTSSASSTLSYGYAADGATETLATCNPGSNQPCFVSSVAMGTGWTRTIIGITTPNTVNGGAYFFIKQSDAVARNIWIDAVRIESGGSGPQYREGVVSLGSNATLVGVNTTAPIANLQVQQSSSTFGLIVKGNGENFLGKQAVFSIQDSIGTSHVQFDELPNETRIYGGSDFWGSAGLWVGPQFTNAVGLRIQGQSGQTANLFDVMDSSTNRLVVISGSGGLGAGGVSIPSTTLNASPTYYSTGTAYQSGTTITGVGTTWTSAMVGMVFEFTALNGTTGIVPVTITAVNSATSLTVNTSQTFSSNPGAGYRIHTPGLVVDASGNTDMQVTSATALQVKNAANSQVLTVDTSGGNLIANGDFETSTTAGWAALPAGATSLATNTANIMSGTTSLAFTNPATANTGVKATAFTQTVAAGTYTLSFNVKTATALAYNSIIAGYNQGAADVPCTTNVVAQGGNMPTGIFTQVNCTFTSTGNLSYVYIHQGASTTARTIYIDGVRLEQSSTSGGFSAGAVGINTSTGFNNRNQLVVNTPTTVASNAAVVVQANSADQIGLVLQAALASSANAFQYRRYDGTVMYAVTGGDGRMITGGPSSVAVLGADSVQLTSYVPGSADYVGLMVSGADSQTKDLVNVGNRRNAGAYTSVFNIAAEGATLFKNRVNSTTGFQIQNASGTSLLKVNTGAGTENVDLGGSLTMGYFSDIRAAETGTATYTVSTAASAYYVSANSTTTAASFTTTFNITGASTTDGTIVVIKASSIKGVTAANQIHTVAVQLNGSTVATLAPATQTTAVTVTRTMIFMRMNGVWSLIGQPATANVANTSNSATTADFAEWIRYSGNTAPQPGEILVVGDDPTSAKVSTTPYDKQIIGVVSTSPYEVAGAEDSHSVIIALTGRVPVKVSLENGPIQKGDSLTSSSTPGVAMKAVKAGKIIGTALADYDGTQVDNKIDVQLGVSYDEPASVSSSLQGSDLTISGAATVNGNMTIGANLYVSGTATFNDLVVNGNAIFNGNLTVQNISVKNITINGHIITAGNTPTIAAGAAAGVADTLNNIPAPTASVDGNDTAGTITVVAGANTVAGDFVEVTFNAAFTKTPKVILNAGNEYAANLKFYRDADTGKFRIKLPQAPTAGQTYTFDYMVVQ